MKLYLQEDKMEKSKVYFMNLRTKPNLNLLDKLERLVKKAGIQNIDFEKKFTAIKIHFGEPGNLAYIRPNYARKIIEILKALGAIPFLTDSNTLYSGKRSNAVDHLHTAMENGFNPIGVGCNVIIADGLKGTEQKEIEINGKHCRAPKIGAAIAEADIIISMNHFKGHEQAGFGGALKNLGMGSGSRLGKLEMHSASKPMIDSEKCRTCGMCIKSCSQVAIEYGKDKKAQIDYEKCIGCGQCIAVCLHGAAGLTWDQPADVLNEKIAEYAYAVVKDKPNFHISFIMNVSPNCDCWASNDMAIVPDIGIAASFDPVALDQACLDLVNNTPVIKGSAADNDHNEIDKFKNVHPGTQGGAGIKHAEKIGLGTSQYELISID